MLKNFILSLVTLVSGSALAQQNSNWGTGMYGGMQGCSYQKNMAAGAQSDNDGLKEIQQAIQDLQKQKKQKQTEMSRLEKRDMRDSLATINDVISSNYSEFIINHIDAGRSCMEYKGLGNGGSVIAAGNEGGSVVQNPGSEPTEPFSSQDWGQICDGSKSGSVSGSVCTNRLFKAEEKGTHTSEECKRALTDYRKQKLQKDKLNREITALDRSIQSEKDRLKDAKEDAALAKSNGPGNSSSDTEGGVCVQCITSGNGYTYQKPQTDWANVSANILTGALVSGLAYESQQSVINSNANLGIPTKLTYPAVGYGMPYFAQGIYGALGGSTGQGGFGCGSSMGNNNMNMGGSAFGYPQNMMAMNTMGGGLFNAGMNPWGNSMNSMMGMGGMMNMNPYGTSMGMGSYGLNGYGMNNYGMNGMSGMNGYNGYGSMISDPSMYQLQLQYQQQASQMQMQYYQQYQQQQMQRYQSSYSLQQEMYNLMYKMQAIQSGYNTNTGYIGNGYLGNTLSSGYTSYPSGGLVNSGYSNYYGISPSTVPYTSSILGTTGR